MKLFTFLNNLFYKATNYLIYLLNYHLTTLNKVVLLVYDLKPYHHLIRVQYSIYINYIRALLLQAIVGSAFVLNAIHSAFITEYKPTSRMILNSIDLKGITKLYTIG